MPYKDFREFLDALRAQDDLLDVERPVDLYLEVGKALKRSYVAQGPAVIFHQNGTKMPLVGGLYSTRSKALLAFEATEENVMAKVTHGLTNPIPSVVVSSGSAPTHEVILTGDQIDLSLIPVPTYSPKDGGPYITPGIVVTNDPETSVPDMGHYRFQVMSKNTMAFLAQPFHRFGKNLAKSIKMGQKQMVGAVVIGTDPILAYTCQVKVGDQVDDFALAGGLRGAPVELVKCKTIDLMVPATAEIVIEFTVEHGETAFEGPLGEYTGYYTGASDKPVARVTAITHRKNPYCQALLTGKPVTENHILKEITFEASAYLELKRRHPTVEKVAILPSGGVSFYVIVSMTPRYAGEARQCMMAALSMPIRPKFVIVVEPDIDVFNSGDVEWALSFRVQPAKDVVIIDDVPAGPLDPSVDESIPLTERTGSAMGIDATRPFGQEYPEVADVPGWESYDFPELDRHKR